MKAGRHCLYAILMFHAALPYRTLMQIGSWSLPEERMFQCLISRSSASAARLWVWRRSTRLRAALRHAARSAQEETRAEFAGLVVDLLKRQVSKSGAPVKLTPKEYDLLAILVRHAGRVVTHRQILAGVWGPAHTQDTQYLRVFIGQLRSKLEDDPTAPEIILTEPGAGYRFAEEDS